MGVFPGLGPPGCGKSTLLRRLELDPVPELDEETRRALLRHAPATVEEYRLARVAECPAPL